MLSGKEQRTTLKRMKTEQKTNFYRTERAKREAAGYRGRTAQDVRDAVEAHLEEFAEEKKSREALDLYQPYDEWKKNHPNMEELSLKVLWKNTLSDPATYKIFERGQWLIGTFRGV